MTNGTLTFAAGDGSKCINLTILNDGEVEPPEWFNVVLSNPTGGVGLGALTNATITILDNDGGLEFAEAEYVVGEASGWVDLTVQRGDDGTNEVSVDYIIRSGTASAGADFASGSGTLRFIPPETKAILRIPILDDALIEGDETFEVSLRHPTGGASLAAKTNAVVRILDDDRPGGVDGRFAPHPSIIGSEVRNIVRMENGRLIVSGRYYFLTDSLEGLPPVIRFLEDGTLDPGFNAEIGPHNGILSIAVQPDGKVLAGSIAFVPDGNIGARALMRMNADGSCDSTFLDACAGPIFTFDWLGTANAIAVQPDQKIILGGSLGPWPDEYGLSRHLPDGTIDTSFATNLNLNVSALALQPDGKIIAAGNRVVRVGTDGVPETDFVVTLGMDSATNSSEAHVNALLLEPDGSIVIGGRFDFVNGVSRTNLARIRTNGTVRAPFSGSTDGEVFALARQTNGQLVVGGAFSFVGGLGRPFVARLNADGSPDPFFDTGIGPNGAVYALATLPDESVLIGGDFTSVNGLSRPHLAKLRAGTALFTTLTLSASSVAVPESAGVVSLTVLRGGYTNGTTVVGYATTDGSATAGEDYSATAGTLTFARGETVKMIAVPILRDSQSEAEETFTLTLSPIAGPVPTFYDQTAATVTIVDDDRAGSLDPTFSAFADPNGYARAVALLPDGRILMAGWNTLVRLFPDGTLDSSFNVSLAPTYWHIFVVVPQPDGRILIGGDFDVINGTPRNFIARLMPDGSLDAGFNAHVGQDGNLVRQVNDIALQSDGRIIFGGYFTNVAGALRQGLARVSSDGTLDLTYNPGVSGTVGYAGGPEKIVLQADGKLLLGGGFSTVAGQMRPYLARLTADGLLDNSFNIGAGPNSWVQDIAVTPGGKIVVAGGFTVFNNARRYFITRLNPDGSEDPTINPGLGPGGPVQSMVVQLDGKVVIAGSFVYSLNNSTRRSLARLNADLSLDTSFDVGEGPEGFLETVALQPDGQVLVGGGFNSFAGLLTGPLVRLNGAGPLHFSPLPRITGNGVTLTLFTQPTRSYVLQRSTNLMDWTNLQTNRATGYTLEMIVAEPAGPRQVFYGARQLEQ
jgi:uncharacterized delta-60 repeat protein